MDIKTKLLAPEQAKKVEQNLNYWINQLRDISARNRLLFWKDTKASSAVITEPELLYIYDWLVTKGNPMLAPLPTEQRQRGLFDGPVENSIDNTSNETVKIAPNEFMSDKTIIGLNNTLRNLRYKSRTIREEQGFNALYIAFGMLKWREGLDGEFTEAPLVLVPIDINRESINLPFKILMYEDEIVINPTLQAHLNKNFGIELPDIPSDLTTSGLENYFKQIDFVIRKLEGWIVLNKVVIGIFNFQTLMIIKDIERNINHYMVHPIIQLLSGLDDVKLSVDYENLPKADELDDKVDPLSVFQILDADSSQQEAIEAAKQGASFVLQGPPGTGKSQTIANIIAESLAMNKNVLFVSQKVAALEVVKDRLNKCGLGEFCLEIHSHLKDKKDVIKDLEKSLVTRTQMPIPNTTYKRTALSKVRSELNQFVRALHRPRYQLGLSLFEIQGRLANLLDAPSLNFSLHNLEGISLNEYHKRLSLVRELATYEKLITEYHYHPWKGVTIKTITLQWREEIAKNFQDCANNIIDLSSNLNEFAEQHGIKVPDTLRDVNELLRVISVYNTDIFTNELSDIVNRYGKEYNSTVRIILPKFWMDSKALAKVHRDGRRLEPNKATRFLQLSSKIRNESIELGLNPISGTDLTEIELRKLQTLYSQIGEKLKFFEQLYSKNTVPPTLINIMDLPISVVPDWFRGQAEKTDELIEWVNFYNLILEANEIGLADFVEQALNTGLPATLWEASYLRRFYLLITDLIVQSDKSLAQFRSAVHDNQIKGFRNLDQEIIELSRLEIQSKLQMNRPNTLWVQADSAETVILKREANKKRRIKPLRVLFKEIPNLLLTLRPCLMMSPLTVSQLLDPEVFHFDIAIFDEASQIPPEYAVGTFVRANQIIIAGDRQQLPPTRFFQAFETDEFEDEENYELAEFESILHACDSIQIPNYMLLWHYRSQDESLIAFSNYQFYDNKLLTFPNADSSRKTTGLEFIYVPDGIYKRGRGARYNLVEARLVAQLVVEHLQNSPELSLGVVTFSQSQRNVIENEIDRIKRTNIEINPLLAYEREEPFFVKNLENVQGDERDVIIFSVGYGKDETGNMSMNFGPLNRQGGERRLNVAITRARIAVKLVASFEPEDIDLARTNSQGAHLLRNYMKTARDGVAAIFTDETYDLSAEFESPFEEAVYNAISKRGINLVKQVGVSNYRIDFGIIDPDKPSRFLLGIECDGAAYHSLPTARVRDRLRQELLENKYGWRIHRIWSRDWINDRDAEINKVLHAIDECKRLGQIRSQQNSGGNPSPFEFQKGGYSPSPTRDDDLRFDTYPSNATYYKIGRLRKQASKGAEDFHNIPIERLVSALKAIVEFEGPLHKEIAKRRVADAFNVRIGKRVNERLNYALYNAKMYGYINIDDVFLWPPNMDKAPLRIHQGDKPARTIEEIPPQEISLGVIECVKNAMSLTEKDLIKETSKMFGLKVTNKVTLKIKYIINSMLRAKQLIIKAGKISLS